MHRSLVWHRSSEDELYRVVVSSHEEKIKQLIVENHELCQFLTYLMAELSSLTPPGCSQQIGSRQGKDTEVGASSG